MIDLFPVILLAVIQGLTEFLPVSSTGHLIILENLFHLPSWQFGLSFDIALHLGTLFALIVYFRLKIIDLLKSFPKGKGNLFWLIILGTIPAILIGILLESPVENFFRKPVFVAVNLIIFSFVFLIAEKISKEKRNLQNLSFSDAITIGFFQTIAFLPGVSRSGITIAGGLFRHLKKEQAAEFAFLLSIPVISIASSKDIFTLVKSGFPLSYFLNFAVGAVVSFITGYICIYYFLGYLKKYGMLPFVIYRVFLGILILIFLY